MPAEFITFKLRHGFDSVPVPAEPYDSIVARSLDAIANHHAENLLDGVEMSFEVRDHLVMHSLIEYPFAAQPGGASLTLFMGQKVTYAHH